MIFILDICYLKFFLVRYAKVHLINQGTSTKGLFSFWFKTGSGSQDSIIKS